MAIRRRRESPQGEQDACTFAVRISACDDQPSAPVGNSDGKYRLREMQDMTIMETGYGREEGNETLNRGDYCTQAELSGHRGVGQGSANGIHPSVRKCEEGKHGYSYERKWSSSVQNLEFSQRDGNVCRNGDARNSISHNKKLIRSINLILDKLIVKISINPHNNNSTKNKKARRQPGFEVNRKSIPDLRLSPLLFAVNQNLGE